MVCDVVAGGVEAGGCFEDGFVVVEGGWFGGGGG